jgi:hypothetical protein
MQAIVIIYIIFTFLGLISKKGWQKSVLRVKHQPCSTKVRIKHQKNSSLYTKKNTKKTAFGKHRCMLNSDTTALAIDIAENLQYLILPQHRFPWAYPRFYCVYYLLRAVRKNFFFNKNHCLANP